MKKDEIRRRLAELTAPATRKARITAESLLTELEETRAGAVLAAQYGAATAAITAKAKISGILVDRLEVGGVNEFSGCQTPQEVVDKLIEQEGAAEALAQLELLHALLIERAGDQAIEVADAEPLPALTFDERWRTADRISGALPGYTKHGYRFMLGFPLGSSLKSSKRPIKSTRVRSRFRSACDPRRSKVRIGSRSVAPHALPGSAAPGLDRLA